MATIQLIPLVEDQEADLGLTREEERRWRLIGYAVIAVSCASTAFLYWKIGWSIAAVL